MNIIQTWKSKDIPAHYQPFIDSVRTHNPDWNYMLFDDDDIMTFVKTKMSKYYNLFMHLPQKIQQIDFFRYLAIYYYGGVYIDLDLYVTQSFDTLYYDNMDMCKFPVELHSITDTIITSQGFTQLIGNYAFYAPPKHPFIKQIIDNIECQRITDANIKIAQGENSDPPSQVRVYCTTGPVLVTQTYIDDSSLAVSILTPDTNDDNCFGNFGVHMCYGSWK